MSASEAADLHEKTKNFLTEAEVDRFLQAAKSGRHGIRDHLMMLLLYRHGLRETELCRRVALALVNSAGCVLRRRDSGNGDNLFCAADVLRSQRRSTQRSATAPTNN